MLWRLLCGLCIAFSSMCSKPDMHGRNGAQDGILDNLALGSVGQTSRQSCLQGLAERIDRVSQRRLFLDWRHTILTVLGLT